MKELKYRFSVIIVLLLASIYALWPRDTTVRVEAPDGSFVYDTVKQIPIKLGLDLKGGMHIALEPDKSKGVATDVKDEIERAVTIVRNRVDGLGVAEANVQREGSERPQLDRDGVEEQDLDVEQDEQHRDEVEADAEAEAALDLGGQAALVRVGLGLQVGAALGTDDGVERDEHGTHGPAEQDEHDRREVGSQHSGRVF